MVSPISLTRYLNKILSVSKIPDYGRNGCQFNSKKNVGKVGVAVDACMQTFEAASKFKCDFLIVHHGLFWRGVRDTDGLRAKRLNFLKKKKISLYAAHLPLDLHPKYGNNAVLADLLGVKDKKPFGGYNGVSIGFGGLLPKKTDLHALCNKLKKHTNTKPVSFHFGPKKIRSVAIVSGGGSSALLEAYESGFDCFITGEGSHKNYHQAKELKLNVILGGHYGTETHGVKQLGQLLSHVYGVEYEFIDVPVTLW